MADGGASLRVFWQTSAGAGVFLSHAKTPTPSPASTGSLYYCEASKCVHERRHCSACVKVRSNLPSLQPPSATAPAADEDAENNTIDPNMFYYCEPSKWCYKYDHCKSCSPFRLMPAPRASVDPPSAASSPEAAPEPSPPTGLDAQRIRLSNVVLTERDKPLSYHDYLHLDKILGAQHPVSQVVQEAGIGEASHDETMFIVTHQVYELWFKLILHELGSAIQMLSRQQVGMEELEGVAARLARVVDIFSVATTQFSVMNTMAPADFLEFRDLITPASGFQSWQFRLIENTLGLPPSWRSGHHGCTYMQALPEEMHERVSDATKGPTLFSAVERWLESLPFVRVPSLGFDFTPAYRAAVERFTEARLSALVPKASEAQDGDAEEQERKNIHKDSTALLDMLDEAQHVQLCQPKGGSKIPRRRLSFDATMGALMLQAYVHVPHFAAHRRVLSLLVEIDAQLTSWRQAHASLVRRQIGSKPGTGGSTGHEYLANTARFNVFGDLSALASLFLPRPSLPTIPPEVLAKAFEPATLRRSRDEEQGAEASPPPTLAESAPSRCPYANVD